MTSSLSGSIVFLTLSLPMRLNIYYQSHEQLLTSIQSLTHSFWGWIVLLIAFIAAVDILLAVVFLLVRSRPFALNSDRQLPKKRWFFLKSIQHREFNDLKIALEKLQEEYITGLLKNINLSEVCIPGVMPLVKERLASNAILTAYDVQFDRLLNMRWLGEAPRCALLSWRAALEDAARLNMPQRLPEEQAAQIRARYEAMRRDIAREGI